jgi:hypothetical protein
MTLVQLRLAFMDESHIERLTASAPPVVRQVNKIERNGKVDYTVEEHAEPADANGRNLAAGMVALLGQITVEHAPDNCSDCQRNPLLNEQRTAYSPRFPVRKALVDFEKQCCRYHRPPQWRDHARGPVCSIMLRLIIEGGASIAWAAEQVDMDYPRAERLVGIGAEHVAKWVTHWKHEKLIAYDAGCQVCRRAPIRLTDGSRVSAA